MAAMRALVDDGDSLSFSSRADLCGECGKEVDTHTFVHIVKLDQTVYDHVVSSFPVFEAKLQHIKYCFTDEQEDEGLVYNGFVQAKGPCMLEEGSILRLCRCYTSEFFIQPEEFERPVDIQDYTLFELNTKVFVLWKWDQIQVERDESDYERTSHKYDDEEKSSEEEHTEDCPESLFMIISKCIGTTKEHRYQETLAEVALSRRNELDVEFRISPEPTNPFDARAIAFKCFLNNRWERVGYMVTDVLSGR